MAAGLSIFLADNSNIHFCALSRKPVWNWKVAVSQGRECLQAQRCYTMSGLVDAKSLGFRAKRRSAGSKNKCNSSYWPAQAWSFHQVSWQWIWVFSHQKSVSTTPCKAMDRRKDVLPPSVLRSLGAAPLISPFYEGFAFPYSFALSAPRELQSGLLSVHGMSC